MGSLGESEKLGGKAASGFVASKWETVDPEEVKKGVVTTSKWETEEKDELVKCMGFACRSFRVGCELERQFNRR